MEKGKEKDEAAKGSTTGWIIRIGSRMYHFIGTLEDAVKYAEDKAGEGEDIYIT